MSKMKWTTGVCVCSAVAMLMNLIGGRLPAAQAAAEGSVSPKVREAWERIGLSGGGTKKWPELLKPENSSITFSAATHLSCLPWLIRLFTVAGGTGQLTGRPLLQDSPDTVVPESIR